MSKIKKKLEYLLKHNAFINKTFKFVLSGVIRFIGLFVAVDKKAVLFTSLNMKYNDSPKAIYEYLISLKEYHDFKFYWAIAGGNADGIPGNCTVIKADTLKYFLTALKCKYWVSSVNIERSLKFKKKSQVYLNTWHGIPIKTVGNESAGRKDYDFSYINRFCISGDYEIDLYKRSFNINETQLLKVGMPRNDVLYNTTEEEIENIKTRLSLPKDKKVILYAPTWRDSKDGGDSYQIKPPMSLDLWQEKLGNEYVLLFRAHHYTSTLLGVEFNDFVLDYSSYPNINDLLKISDILISDYSATIFDYSILERPIICFSYDFEQYVVERGFAMNYKEELGSMMASTENEVFDKILNLDAKKAKEETIKLKNKYIAYGGNATEKCVEALFSKKGEK